MGEPPKKKRHHFVPKFVLRNFSLDAGSVPTFVLESGDVHANASVRDFGLWGNGVSIIA